MESRWEDAGDSFGAVFGPSRWGNAEVSDLFALHCGWGRSYRAHKIEERGAELPVVARGIKDRCCEFLGTDGWRGDGGPQERCAALHAHPVQIQRHRVV